MIEGPANSSSNTKAIVTLAIGEEHLAEFVRTVKPTWDEYCKRQGYDLYVLTEPIDTQADLVKKPIQWQKLLIFKIPNIERYDHIAWIDTDVLINYHLAPCIASALKQGKIGAIDGADEIHTIDELENLKTRFTALNTMFVARSTGAPADANVAITKTTMKDLYAYYGFDLETPHFMNAGVYVFDPKRHSEFLEWIYRTHEQRFMDTVFSYELIRNEMVEFVDPRFNLLWPIECAKNYPFLFSPEFLVANPETVRMCVNTAFRNSYYLHFAGNARHAVTKQLIQFVEPAIANTLELVAPGFLEAFSNVRFVSREEAADLIDDPEWTVVL